MVLAYARKRVGHDVGEEIAARTFLVAFEDRAKCRGSSGSAKPWLLGIATHLIRGHRRLERAYLQASPRLATPESESPVDEYVEKVNISNQLRSGLSKLDAEDRDALLLLAIADLSYADIAVALRI